MPLLLELAKRLDGLIAEDALRRLQATAAGSGMMRKSDREQLVDAWASLARKHQRRRRMSADQIALAAEAAGIHVVREKASGRG